MKPPAIKVEIIHIEGPLKGTIQEFYDPVIEIGRHPDCHVCFPKDMNTISRNHAEIRREGNRFMAVDHSTNGTLVNGKPIQELILKDGDVLTISENGPKISILTTIIKEEELPPEIPTKKHYPEEPLPVSPTADALSQQSLPLTNDKKDTTPGTAAQSIQKPFIIQFGAKIKSFQTLPITLGQDPECDFTIEHPAILAQHVQIRYHDNSYQIKDLTGRDLVTINSKLLADEAPLVADTCVSLSSKGPTFQFLGEGRLAEIETSPDTDAGRNKLDSYESDKPGAERKKKSFWPFTKK